MKVKLPKFLTPQKGVNLIKMVMGTLEKPGDDVWLAVYHFLIGGLTSGNKKLLHLDA